MATLRQIIDALPIGKENAMKVSDFEQAIGNVPSGTNNDQTRREVKDAIDNNEIPIGSSPPRGYWLINSDEEFQEVIDGLNSIIETYTTKRDSITRGWERRRRSLDTTAPWPK
ncbi:MAG: hypothetical protein ABIK15_03320 [Pseudomonadota bacterium]